MIVVVFNKPDFEYDVHSLLKEFFPQEDVQMYYSCPPDEVREAGARRIYGFVEDDNIRSKRLCERLGMRREGCFKEFVTFVNNPDGSPKYEDTCVYAILEKEWNTIRQW